MYDPISVDTALVSSGGDLLIQLTDGTIVNAGRVRGMPGPQGEKGEQGIRGAHGKDGIDGTNGAKWHTGVGTPDIDLGVNGDLYMDVASSLLPIWQKVNGDWLFLANLKPTPQFAGGGEGAAGGGGSVIIHPGPQPPIVDNDNRPIQEGDLWVDINGNHLYVYYNGVWSEVTTCSVGGGSATGDFLKRYGDTGDDAEEDVDYKWNKQLTFESDEDIIFKTPWDIYEFSYEKFVTLEEGMWVDVPSEDGYIVLNVDGTELFIFEDAIGLNAGYAYAQCEWESKFTLFGRRDRASLNGGFYGEAHVSSGNEIVIGHYADPYNKQIVWIQCKDNKGYYTGLIEDDESLVNKQYVDAKVINLQEEIETIAPTVQAGIWQDGNSATPGTGRFAMRLGNGSVTQDYTDTTIVTLIISTTDKAGGAHTFEKEEVGDEIQLFDVEDQNFGLFKIDVIDNTDPNYVQFTVTHLRGLGSTHVDDDVIIRTFKPVTSGDGTAYLLKNGEYVDPPSAVTFEWTKNVEFVTKNSTVSIENNWVDITSKNIQLLGKGGGKIFLQSEGKIELEAQTTLKIYSKSSDVTLVADGNEVIYRDIEDTDPPEQIVNKQYVDKLFDFSQYDPLP